MADEISKLPPSASQAYAKNQEAYDKRFSQEGQQVSQRSVSSSLEPTPSHLEMLVPQGQGVSTRAAFSPPPLLQQGGTSAFASQLTRGIGPGSSWEDRSEKVLALARTLPAESEERVHMEKFIQQANQLNTALLAIKAQVVRFLGG